MKFSNLLVRNITKKIVVNIFITTISQIYYSIFKHIYKVWFTNLAVKQKQLIIQNYVIS